MGEWNRRRFISTAAAGGRQAGSPDGTRWGSRGLLRAGTAGRRAGRDPQSRWRSAAPRP